jgi:hypothetical protein
MRLRRFRVRIAMSSSILIQAKHARVYPVGKVDDRRSRLDAVLSRMVSLLRRFFEYDALIESISRCIYFHQMLLYPLTKRRSRCG